VVTGSLLANLFTLLYRHLIFIDIVILATKSAVIKQIVVRHKSYPRKKFVCKILKISIHLKTHMNSLNSS
jgi:hypothetical protein